MKRSGEAQEVQIRMKYPRAQQDGEAGTMHIAEAHSAAYVLPDKDLHSFRGTECLGRRTGTHRSDSAGAALPGEPDETQPASSKVAVYHDSAKHEELDVALHHVEAADISRCGTPEQGVHAFQPLHQDSADACFAITLAAVRAIARRNS